MSTKSIAPLRLCVLAILLLTCAIGALAQSQATTGNIEGRVLDPKDAALPGASVTVINQQTGLEKTTTTDDLGVFGYFSSARSVHRARKRHRFLTNGNP